MKYIVCVEQLCQTLTQYLKNRGVPALDAWPGDGRELRKTPAVVVSLRKCEAGPCGFQDYLGDQFNPETQQWEELFGKRAQISFGLDLYVRAEAGEERLQQTFDLLTQALQEGGPDGLSLRELTCGETQYDSNARLLKRSAQAQCTACLYAAAQPGGEFLSFEIRGGIR